MNHLPPVSPSRLILAALLAAAPFDHTRAADFPEPFDTETKLEQFLPPNEALQRLTLPPGFTATLATAEPDVLNPVSMSWDSKGRLWVAECLTYGEFAFDLSLRDRILIFEDTTGDGVLDSRKVFHDELQQVTSIEIAPDGVWVIAAPQLLFIPDADRDDRPDGPPIPHLDGFKVPPDSYHNLANGLRHGPDGWIYGRCGATGAADVGPPGAPDDQRVPVRGGMWRYHPRTRAFEAITSGNTNPWGHDWNEHGQLFYVNTVNGHFWHATPGAHFVRAHTLDPNTRAYHLIDTHADHWHFDTALGWQDTARRKDVNLSDALGGGHVHIGAMFYFGTNWPAEYRGQFFTLNQHGRRANQEHVERHGSGYAARHRPDFFKTSDAWFLGIELSYGPDGSVFVIDWSDTGECHERDGVHRNSGRIYRIHHGENPARVELNLGKASPAELAALHTHPNEWFARRARVELASRKDAAQAAPALVKILREHEDVVARLRALWTLHTIEALDTASLLPLLDDPSEHIRVWAVRLLTDHLPLDTLVSHRPPGREDIALATPILERLAGLAATDPSGLVRLTLASTLQRLPAAQRPALAAPLLARTEDAEDHNLPLMLWYGLIPLGDTDPAALARLAADCRIPLTRQCMFRRLAEDIEKNAGLIAPILAAATSSGDNTLAADLATGLTQAFTGWRKAPKPGHWESFSSAFGDSPDFGAQVRDLSALFGDGRALDEIRATALDSKVPVPQRKAALQTLIDQNAPDLRATCEKLLGERYVNPVAAAGLARVPDAKTAGQLAGAYRRFHHTERDQLIAILTSRPEFATALLDAIAAGRIPRQALTPYHARQIENLGDAAVLAKLGEVWGGRRESPAEKAALIEEWKQKLGPSVLQQADTSNGRVVFNTACATCHRLHGHGGALGPDLTGAGRDSIHYLLENLIDPGAQVAADYRLQVLTLEDGRVLSGIISARGPKTVTLQTMTGAETLESASIRDHQDLPASLMPDGILQSLTPEQARDLIAYLMHPAQVPLP